MALKEGFQGHAGELSRQLPADTAQAELFGKDFGFMKD
jgi:hypothetical protein